MFDSTQANRQRPSVVEQIVRTTAYMGGALVAVAFMGALCMPTAGAPASRRLNKEAICLHGLEPVPGDCPSRAVPAPSGQSRK